MRSLTAEDYDALVALWEDAGLPYRPHGRDARARIAREIDGPCSAFLGVERDGRLVGAVLGTHDGRKGWINRLAVDPKHRREGIGRTLVAALEAHFAALDIHIVACHIEDWNATSRTIFEQFGYRPHPDILYFTKRDSAET
ncbi:MAG: GNAT family N-acetyltransferase [Candidatus Bipolaricaulota bacterium]|nr:MAG: GNAT family N-acetyltransferase [Candidatus Bipolaricaulota bacterium]